MRDAKITNEMVKNYITKHSESVPEQTRNEVVLVCDLEYVIEVNEMEIIKKIWAEAEENNTDPIEAVKEHALRVFTEISLSDSKGMYKAVEDHRYKTIASLLRFIGYRPAK